MLNRVGSYGSQLSTLIEMVDMLRQNVTINEEKAKSRKSWKTPGETLAEFEDLAKRSYETVEDYRKDNAHREVRRFLDDLSSLAETDNFQFEQYLSELSVIIARGLRNRIKDGSKKP